MIKKTLSILIILSSIILIFGNNVFAIASLEITAKVLNSNYPDIVNSSGSLHYSITNNKYFVAQFDATCYGNGVKITSIEVASTADKCSLLANQYPGTNKGTLSLNISSIFNKRDPLVLTVKTSIPGLEASYTYNILLDNNAANPNIGYTYQTVALDVDSIDASLTSGRIALQDASTIQEGAANKLLPALDGVDHIIKGAGVVRIFKDGTAVGDYNARTQYSTLMSYINTPDFSTRKYMTFTYKSPKQGYVLKTYWLDNKQTASMPEKYIKPPELAVYPSHTTAVDTNITPDYTAPAGKNFEKCTVANDTTFLKQYAYYGVIPSSDLPELNFTSPHIYINYYFTTPATQTPTPTTPTTITKTPAPNKTATPTSTPKLTPTKTPTPIPGVSLPTTEPPTEPPTETPTETPTSTPLPTESATPSPTTTTAVSTPTTSPTPASLAVELDVPTQLLTYQLGLLDASDSICEGAKLAYKWEVAGLNDSESKDWAKMSSAKGFAYWESPGTYRVKVTVEATTYKPDGTTLYYKTDSAVKYVKVVSQYPRLQTSVTGHLKECRKFTFEATATSDLTPINPNSYVITLLKSDGTAITAKDNIYFQYYDTSGQPHTSQVDGSIWGVSKVNFMSKTAGTYIIKIEVSNTGGYTAKAQKSITIAKDEPPVAQIYVPSMCYRDYGTAPQKYAKTTFTDLSYSPDGDTMLEKRYFTVFDSNNDGSTEGEAVTQAYPDNRIQLNNGVGKYWIGVQAIESIPPDDTLPDFIYPSDYKTSVSGNANYIGMSNPTSVSAVPNVEVKNMAPTCNLFTSTKRMVDLLVYDKTNLAKISALIEKPLSDNNIDYKIIYVNNTNSNSNTNISKIIETAEFRENAERFFLDISDTPHEITTTTVDLGDKMQSLNLNYIGIGSASAESQMREILANDQNSGMFIPATFPSDLETPLTKASNYILNKKYINLIINTGLTAKSDLSILRSNINDVLNPYFTANNINATVDISSNSYSVTRTWTPTKVYANNNGGYYVTMSDGTVWAKGTNAYGQLGTGNTSTYAEFTKINITDVKDMLFADSESIGADIGNSVLALKNDGTVWAWGKNLTDSGIVTTPTQITQTSDGTAFNGIIGISSTCDNSVALKSDGTLYVWGTNASGQLGNGTLNSSSKPFKTSLTNVKQAIATQTGVVALKNDGTVWVAGDNYVGQSGYQTGTGKVGTARSNLPLYVTNFRKYDFVSNVSQIAANYRTIIAIKNDSTAYIWGDRLRDRLDGLNWDNKVDPYQIIISGFTGKTSKFFDAQVRNRFALLNDQYGRLCTFGKNVHFELGTGRICDYEDETGIPRVSNISSGSIAKLFQGRSMTIMINKQNTPIAWGWEGGGNKSMAYPKNYSKLNNYGPITDFAYCYDKTQWTLAGYIWIGNKKVYTYNFTTGNIQCFNNFQETTDYATDLNTILNNVQISRPSGTTVFVDINDGIRSELNVPDSVVQKLKDKDMYFVGLGTNVNYAQNCNTVASNAGKGYAGENNSDLSAAFQKLAEYCTGIGKSFSNITNGKYVLKDETVNYSKLYSDYEGDTIGGETFKYTQNPNYFENSEGYITDTTGKYTGIKGASLSGRDVYSPILSFDKPGKYAVTYVVKDTPSADTKFSSYAKLSALSTAEIIVHRRPIAQYSFTVQSSQGNYTPVFNDTSYDPDHASSSNRGIVSEIWKWKRSGTSAWTIGRPTKLEKNSVYTFSLEVKDPEGIWSYPKIRTYDTQNLPPTIDADPTSKVADNSIAIKITANDNGENDFARLHYVFTKSQAYPSTNNVWTEHTASKVANVNLQDIGTWYLHMEAFDWDCNGSYQCRGPYTVNKLTAHDFTVTMLYDLNWQTYYFDLSKKYDSNGDGVDEAYMRNPNTEIKTQVMPINSDKLINCNATAVKAGLRTKGYIYIEGSPQVAYLTAEYKDNTDTRKFQRITLNNEAGNKYSWEFITPMETKQESFISMSLTVTKDSVAYGNEIWNDTWNPNNTARNVYFVKGTTMDTIKFNQSN